MEPMLAGTFRVGSLKGITIRIHFLFVLLCLLVLLQGGDTVGSALLLLVLFGSVFLHELGHCFGARAVGGEAHELVLWPLGGFTRMRIPRTAKGEFVSMGAGPATNLALALAGAFGLLVAGLDMPFDRALAVAFGQEAAALHRELLLQITVTNTLLFGCNVIPTYPLDGGRLLRSMLWPLLGWRRASIAAGVTAVAVATLLAGVAILLREGILLLLAAVALWLSWRELQQARAARPPAAEDLMAHESEAG